MPRHLPTYLRIERLAALHRFTRKRRAKSKVLRQRLFWRAVQERCRSELNWLVPGSWMKPKPRNPNDYGFWS